jgi:hypothetical protein
MVEAAMCPDATADIDRGVALFTAFNRFAPAALMKVRQPRIVPPVLVDLGEAVGLIYRSDKWQPGRPRTYIHFMEHPPRLASNVAGTQLFLIGGSYRVTARGIEG